MMPPRPPLSQNSATFLPSSSEQSTFGCPAQPKFLLRFTSSFRSRIPDEAAAMARSSYRATARSGETAAHFLRVRRKSYQMWYEGDRDPFENRRLGDLATAAPGPSCLPLIG